MEHHRHFVYPRILHAAYTSISGEHFTVHSSVGKDQNTTPGSSCPTVYEKCASSFMSRADHNTEDAGEGAYGLSSLSEKTRISNNLQMSLQMQHILLSYFQTLSVGPVWESNPRPLAR